MKRIIRIGVLVAPWLMAVALPIWLFPGFAVDVLQYVALQDLQAGEMI